MSKTITAKVTVPHRKGCRAVQLVADGSWATPWCGHPLRTLWLSRIGTHHGSWCPWFEIQCNTTDCPGRKIIKVDVLAMHELG